MQQHVVRVLSSAFALAAATAVPAAAWSPADSATIRGVVVDAVTGAPLPGAAVRVVELRRDDLTHADGSYRLGRLPPGSYTLTFERIGYRRQTRQIRVQEGDSVVLNVGLEVSAIALPGLVVTGPLGARSGAEVFRPTHVLSGQELAGKMDVTVAATLQDQPGIAAGSMGPATARPVIRGMGGDRILLLEDGQRVGDVSAGGADHAVSIEPATAKQIEVVRGPAALLFGSNALGGVVNVIREEVPGSLADEPHGTISVQGQSVSRGINGAGFVTGALGSIALRAEASARTAGDQRTPAGTLENTSIDTYNLSAGASWVGDWGHAGGAYRYYDSRYGIPGGFEGGHEEGVGVEMYRHTFRGEAKLRSGFGPFASIDVDGAYNRYYHREIEHGGVLGTEFGQLSAVGGALARHEELGPFSGGAVGVQLQWRDFATGGSLNTPPAKEYAAAAYVLEELSRARWRFQFGGRFDWHRVEPLRTSTSVEIGDVRTRNFGSVSGSVGVLYDVGSGIGIGASVARAFRTPDINELFSQGPHLASYSFEVGNPDLDAEAGVGLDAFVRVDRERFQAELAAFRNDIGGYIYPRNTGELSRTRLPIYQFTGEDALFAGVEGSAQWNALKGVVVEASGAYVRGTLSRTGEPLPFIPPLNGQLGLRLESPDYFVRGGVRLAARQDRVGEFEEPTDAYAVLHVGAGLRWVAFGRLHAVTLRVDNLANVTYREHLSRLKSIMPAAGRGVSLLYRLSF